VHATAQEDEANYSTQLNSKLGYLTGVVDSADAAPTEAELAVFAELDKQLEAQLVIWRGVLSKDLPALNESMRKSNVPSVAPAAGKADLTCSAPVFFRPATTRSSSVPRDEIRLWHQQRACCGVGR
jgi:hypothetical protein